MVRALLVLIWLELAFLAAHFLLAPPPERTAARRRDRAIPGGAAADPAPRPPADPPPPRPPTPAAMPEAEAGATEEVLRERPVRPHALDWLARHQGRDGLWSADGFALRCRGAACGGAGHRDADLAATGLALLAFGEAGVTHRLPPSNHGPVVRDALRALGARQWSDGAIGLPDGTSTRPDTPALLLGHACATLGLVEQYRLSSSAWIREPAERALAFLLAEGRAGPPPAGILVRDDASAATAWIASLAAKAAHGAGLAVPAAYRERLEAVAREGFTARPGDPAGRRLLDAGGLVVEAIWGFGLEGLGRDRASDWLEGTRVAAGGPSRDPAEAWLRMQVAWEVTGAPWRAERDEVTRWTREAARPAGDGCAAGSLDPSGRFGRAGGRVVATALLALTGSRLLTYEACRRARVDEAPAADAVEETVAPVERRRRIACGYRGGAAAPDAPPEPEPAGGAE